MRRRMLGGRANSDVGEMRSRLPTHPTVSRLHAFIIHHYSLNFTVSHLLASIAQLITATTRCCSTPTACWCTFPGRCRVRRS